MPALSRRDLFLAGLAASAAVSAAGGLAFAAEPPEGVWDLTDLYPSDAAWDAELAAIRAALPGLKAYKGTLGQGPKALLTALQAASDVNRRLDRLEVYAGLKADADTNDSADHDRRDLAQSLDSAVGEATAWINPEVLSLGADKVAAFEAAEPGLARFRFPPANVLRRAPHTLDDEGEALLATAETPLSGPDDIRTQLVNADIPWPTITLSTGPVRLDDQGFEAARQSPNRDDRKLAFDTFWATYGVYKTSLAASLSAQVQGHIFEAKARKYPNSLASALSRNNVPEGVYNTLVKETRAGLPVLHRYFKLRQKLLGLPDMRYYDIYPPVVKLDRKFTLADDRTLTLAAVRPLGADYVANLAKATAGRWMDAYPRKGKASGAYMNGSAYDVHPYLLLNLTDDY